VSRRSPGGELEHLLQPDETVVVSLNGVVKGFTRLSGLAGILGIVAALTVPRVLDLPFVLGVLTIVVVLGLVFLLIYYGAGRPLARRSEPPLSGPYLSLVLTDRRVLLLDRDLGSDQPELAESVDLRQVSTVRYGKAGALVPQRLGYVIDGTGRREYEFPRSEPVRDFVAVFSE
jgi:hypothetical protein